MGKTEPSEMLQPAVLQWAAAAACRSDFLSDASELRTGDRAGPMGGQDLEPLTNGRPGPGPGHWGDASDE